MANRTICLLVVACTFFTGDGVGAGTHGAHRHNQGSTLDSALIARTSAGPRSLSIRDE